MFQKPQTFVCHRGCGYCCTNIVVLTKQDIARIKKMGFQEKDFIETDSLGRKRLKRDKYEDAFCHFFAWKKGSKDIGGKEAVCTIYKNRPEVCRKYPFFEDAVGECCPPKLFLEGKLYQYVTTEPFEGKRLEKAKPL